MTQTKNQRVEIDGKTGEYTGFSYLSMMHNFSMYDGSVIRLSELQALKKVGGEILYPHLTPTKTTRP